MQPSASSGSSLRHREGMAGVVLGLLGVVGFVALRTPVLQGFRGRGGWSPRV